MTKVCVDEKSRKKKLFSMVRHANETVPFYMDLYQCYQDAIEGEEFSKLPATNKDMYVCEREGALSIEYMEEHLKGDLLWARTCNDAGIFSEVHWYSKEILRTLLPVWLLRKKFYDISGMDRMCYFYQENEDDNLYIDQGNSLPIPMRSLYDSKMGEVYKKILSYNPEWMILRPSIAMMLCDYAEQYGIPTELRYIEFAGESLDPSVRKRTEQIFRCRTAYQYVVKEVNSVAYECPCGKLHILSDNVYMETLADRTDPKASYLCVTTLQNYAMPVIRFQLEDRGEIHRNVACDCGCTGDILELESVRKNDMVVMKDHSREHPYMLMELFHTLNDIIDGGILQYRVEQTAWNQFTVHLALEEEDLQDEIEEELQFAFDDRLDCKVELSFVYYEPMMPAVDVRKNAIFQTKLQGDEL